MKGWQIIGGVTACAALLWGAQQQWQIFGSNDAPLVEQPRLYPKAYRPEKYLPPPLPGLGGVDPSAQPLPTDAPLIAANTLRPTTYQPEIAPDTASVGRMASLQNPAEAVVAGSIRMPTDPEAFGATGTGFVPVGGDVPQTGLAEHVPTIDLTDPEELAFKREAGDLTNPIDEEEQIKRNAFGDGQWGGSDTADQAPSPSAQEYHVGGRQASPEDAPDSAKEVHRDGARPVFDWRAAGLSPTEANAVPVPDLTNTTLANAPAPVPAEASETWREDPVPTWDGPGTDARDP